MFYTFVGILKYDQMITIPEKYEPLNTEEKITALYEELKSKGYSYSVELEIAILYKIRKAKLQIFLKDLLKQLPKKAYSPTIIPKSSGKKGVISEQNVLVSIPTKKIKSYHLDSNDKKVQEKILKKRAELEAKRKREEARPIQKKSYLHFKLKEEVDAFIQEGNVTSIQEARNLIEHANCMATDTSVYIYLRRQLNELIERIKLTHFSGAYKKMQRQQDLDKEMLDRGPSAKIMYIPSGGQNKRY